MTTETSEMLIPDRILQLLEIEGIDTLFGIPDPCFITLFTIAEQRHLNWAAKQSLPDAVYQPEPPTIVDSIDDTPLFGGLL